MTEDFIT